MRSTVALLVLAAFAPVFATAAPAAPPVPVFVNVSNVPASIHLGEIFTVTFAVRNDGARSDDGRISVSIPSFATVTDAQLGSPYFEPHLVKTYPGQPLTDVNCQPITAGHLSIEFRDNDWLGQGLETHHINMSIRPLVAGTFDMYVRATMHVEGGAPCELVTALPAVGDAGFTDQQGFAVKRIQVTVLPAPPLGPPTLAFAAPVSVTPQAIAAGGTTRITVTVSNNGGRSDDGRIVVAFPSLTDPGDIQYVDVAPGTSTSGVPGYVEHAAGSLLPFRGCGAPSPAGYLQVEYVDHDWTTGETHTLVIDVRPPASGVFDVQVRTTMHDAVGPGCAFVSAAPAVNFAVTDQQGWDATVFGIGVGIDPSSPPVPAFVTGLRGLPSEITLGQQFTFSITMRNHGGMAYKGRIHTSFPTLTLISDGNDCITASMPGAHIGPWGGGPGAGVSSASCQSITNPYWLVDGFHYDWPGMASTPLTLSITARPIRTGWFIIDLRGSMDADSDIHDCTAFQTLPIDGVGGQQYLDARGYPIKRYAVMVHGPTAAQVALESVTSSAGHVRLVWVAAGASSRAAMVYRQQDGGDWQPLGTPHVDGDRFAFDDRSVVAGNRYAYRLGIQEDGGETFSSPTWVTVPLRAMFALGGASPNPGRGRFDVMFSLPDGAPATLGVYDLAGRLVALREVGGLGAGEHRVALAPSLPAGVYLIRLTRGDQGLTAKAAVLE